MARAETPTLLSLDRYATIMGIPPMHFNQAVSDEVFPVGGACNDLWWQHSWQRTDRVSREDLAREIAQAEQEIKNEIGYWPAPTWVTEEVRQFPRHYRPDVYRLTGENVRGQRVGIKAGSGKIIAAGVRNTTELPGATIAYSDTDLDGFRETATVTVATTLTDVTEIKVFFDGEAAAPEWEIRPARSRTADGALFTATFWTWQCIDPTDWEQFPPVGDELTGINISGNPPTNTIAAVDVYRVWNDTTQTSAQFYWEPHPRSLIVTLSACPACGGLGCAACQYTTQDGCLHVRDANRGIVVPQPATYDAADADWTQDAFTVCHDPDFVKIWYYAGQIDERYLRGQTDDPLSDYWARIIAWLATARIERSFCSCTNVKKLVDWLRVDLALIGETSYQVNPNDLDNPFGTRRGEVNAWRRIGATRDRLIEVALI